MKINVKKEFINQILAFIRDELRATLSQPENYHKCECPSGIVVNVYPTGTIYCQRNPNGLGDLCWRRLTEYVQQCGLEDSVK